MANTDAPHASPTQNSFPAWYLRRGTMNATDNMLDKASSSCERWEIGCAAVVVLSVAAEFALASIHPPYDSSWNRWGSSIFDAAIALGIVGEVIFGRLDARIQTELRRRSNDKLSDAINRLAQVEFDNGFLEESVAKANERAAQADLKRVELEAKLGQRRLSEQQADVLVRELQGKIAPMYVRGLGDRETALYANQFFSALNKAGLIENGGIFSALATSGPAGMTGIHVYLPLSGDTPAETASADQLPLALKAAGLDVSGMAWGPPEMFISVFPPTWAGWKLDRRVLIVADKPLL
jgi:hypothetical protein